MALPPLTAWLASGLRVTAFLAPGVKLGEPPWWSNLTGSEPENRISRPKASELIEEGPYTGGHKLTLRLQPDRVDWYFQAVEVEGEVELPSIGTLPEALDSFLTITRRWLDVSPALARLAFGAVLLQPVPDRRSGYVHIMNYLPGVKLDPDGSSDFLYQINRSRPSRSVEGLVVNRLTKWSVLRLGRLHFTIGKTSSEIQQVEEKHACRLELDVNTSQDFRGELPRERLRVIFDELIDLSVEIAARGDIP